MNAIIGQIKDAKLTQKEAAKRFGVTQPCISNLMHGRISLFGLDNLVNMAAAAGLQVDVRLVPKPV